MLLLRRGLVGSRTRASTATPVERRSARDGRAGPATEGSVTETIIHGTYLGHRYVMRVYSDPEAADGWVGAYAEIDPDGGVRYWTPVAHLGALLGRPPRSAEEAVRSVKLEIIAMHEALSRFFPGQYE